MRCKKHFSDISSCVGVCASCLRERLLSVVEAQSRLSSHFTPFVDDRCNSDAKLHHQPPPPLVFPRSVSPYISRRKSDASGDVADFSDHQFLQQRRFFSTPQVDTASTKRKSKFHAIANLFRSRSGKSGKSASDPFSIGRKNTALGLFSLDETSAYDGRRGRWFGSRNRGMSPETRGIDNAGGYSPEPWKRTPSSAHGSTRTSQVRVKSSHVASGIGICLSPLMRPSTNRSRKFADLVRFNHNH